MTISRHNSPGTPKVEFSWTQLNKKNINSQPAPSLHNNFGLAKFKHYTLMISRVHNRVYNAIEQTAVYFKIEHSFPSSIGKPSIGKPVGCQKTHPPEVMMAAF